MKFEDIDDNHQRAKVFGGWLVKTYESVHHEANCNNPVEAVVMLRIYDDWGSAKLEASDGSFVDSDDYYALIKGEKYLLQQTRSSGGCSGHGMGSIDVGGFNAVRLVNGSLETNVLDRHSKIECVLKAT